LLKSDINALIEIIYELGLINAVNRNLLFACNCSVIPALYWSFGALEYGMVGICVCGNGVSSSFVSLKINLAHPPLKWLAKPLSIQ
jgi:hypothetical protein